MADVVLFHHAQGCTEGVRAFADDLRAAGHNVTVPDLYDGAVFTALEEGMAHVRSLGFDTVIERGRSAADDLPDDIVYAGMSLGVLPAQLLAQTRAGAKGALLMFSCVPPAEFGGAWPAGVPVQIHGMDADPEFVDEGDLDAARELVAHADAAELFLYPGDKHLFVDNTLADYDAAAAGLLTRRVVEFLNSVV